MKSTPEHDIQRILNGLRDTNPPADLEARITHRLCNATASRTAGPSLFAAGPSLFAAGPSLFAVILNAVKDPRISLATATGYVLPAAALLTVLAISLSAPHLHHGSAVHADIPHRATMPQAPPTQIAVAYTQPPVRKATHPQFHMDGPSCDCDESALAETLAPSHPAPPMPLTAQERRLVLATRPGAPIEVAELEQLREPMLRAAEVAREHDNLRQYIHGLLSPLAVARALDASSPTPANDPPPTPEAADPNQP